MADHGLRTYRHYLAQVFPGQHVRKLCLSAAFTCPNIDGSRGRGGCSWCNNAGFAPAANQIERLRGQWDAGRAALRRRHRHVDGFIAYFQAYSNTYSPLAQLKTLYDPIPDNLPECCGLSISTRPDCVSNEALDYLAQRAQSTYLCLELGLQTDSDHLLRRYNRGHGVATCLDAIERASSRGIELCIHIILGLPGEDDDAPTRIGRLLASLPVRSVKLHNFHVMHGTPLAKAHAKGRCPVPDRATWLDMAERFIRELRDDQYLQRVIADAPDHLLASDPWCHDKQGILTALRHRLTPA